MMRRAVALFLAGVSLCCTTPASAGLVDGRIQSIDGHIYPACRIVTIKRTIDGALVTYRIPDTGTDNSILAVAMMAFSQDRPVTLFYSDGATTGCGPEFRIEWIRVSNPG